MASTAGSDDAQSSAKRVSPPAAVVHLALVITQVSFGGGSIVGKFGVHGTNPVLFALIREGVAGPILWLMSVLLGGECTPKRRDMGWLLAAGFFIFGNQFCFIVGVKLADPVFGSAWQLTQPIFTLCLAVLAGYEKFTALKIVGMVIALGGAGFMVLYNSGGGGDENSNAAYGHLLFALNCLGTSAYVITSKDLVKRYKAASVVGWSYICASVMMVCACLLINNVDALISFVCTDPDPAVERQCIEGKWDVPSSMILPLLYWILFNSLTAYFLMTWAVQFAKASVVSIYAVFQPLTSGCISYLLIAIKGKAWGEEYGLSPAGPQDFGILFIFLGILVMFREPTMDASQKKTDSEASGSLLEPAQPPAVSMPQVKELG